MLEPSKTVYEKGLQFDIAGDEYYKQISRSTRNKYWKEVFLMLYEVKRVAPPQEKYVLSEPLWYNSLFTITGTSMVFLIYMTYWMLMEGYIHTTIFVESMTFVHHSVFEGL